MSMISMLIDRLRSPADLYDGKTQPPMERELQRPHLAQELHDDLQRANAENDTLRQQLADVTESMGRAEERCAKLRDERDMYRDLVGMMDHPDLNAQLNAENSKLRELVMMAYKAATEPDCADCYNEHSCKNNDLSYCVMWVELEQKMRDELGVEVPE